MIWNWHFLFLLYTLQSASKVKLPLVLWFYFATIQCHLDGWLLRRRRRYEDFLWHHVQGCQLWVKLFHQFVLAAAAVEIAQIGSEEWRPHGWQRDHYFIHKRAFPPTVFNSLLGSHPSIERDIISSSFRFYGFVNYLSDNALCPRAGDFWPRELGIVLSNRYYTSMRCQAPGCFWVILSQSRRSRNPPATPLIPAMFEWFLTNEPILWDWDVLLWPPWDECAGFSDPITFPGNSLPWKNVL